MGHYLVLLVFWSFVAYVVALVIRAVVSMASKEQVPLVPPEVQPKHTHEWRQVTEFVRQCRFRECSKVEISKDAPDGMLDYVDLMTTVEARSDPNGRASHYYETDPRMWGPACPNCQRVIGLPWNLAKSPFEFQFEHPLMGTCPYCQKRLQFVDVDKKWIFADELPKGE